MGALTYSELIIGLLLHGLVFNNMLSHLLRGDFSVDADIIWDEAFLRDGKTYTYFGVTPVVLRIPLLLIGRLITDITILSIIIAACMSAYFKWASVSLINSIVPKSRLQTTVYAAFVLSIFIGGPQIQFLKASIYQEVMSWAMALSAAFVYCAMRGTPS
jgi:hypothetical protein